MAANIGSKQDHLPRRGMSCLGLRYSSVLWFYSFYTGLLIIFTCIRVWNIVLLSNCVRRNLCTRLCTICSTQKMNICTPSSMKNLTNPSKHRSIFSIKMSSQIIFKHIIKSASSKSPVKQKSQEIMLINQTRLYSWILLQGRDHWLSSTLLDKRRRGL